MNKTFLRRCSRVPPRCLALGSLRWRWMQPTVCGAHSLLLFSCVSPSPLAVRNIQDLFLLKDYRNFFATVRSRSVFFVEQCSTAQARIGASSSASSRPCQIGPRASAPAGSPVACCGEGTAETHRSDPLQRSTTAALYGPGR